MIVPEPKTEIRLEVQLLKSSYYLPDINHIHIIALKARIKSP